MFFTTVTKRFEFDYAHYLPDYPGKCQNLHGHRGTCEITVSGPPIDNQKPIYPGMVMDFGDLKEIVEREVIRFLDHRCLNENTEMENPTAENTAKWIWNKLFPFFRDRLVRVRVYETPDSYSDVFYKE